ncbi:MAG TPA: uroporphyrinogen decarboxylase family protein [Fimbriimonas sp.]
MSPKERYLACLAGEEMDRPPVTPIFMAWAAHRVGRSYRDYYLDASALVEAQLAVVREFGLDQASTISDPWREADGYGTQLDYPENGVGIARRYLFADRIDPNLLRPFNPCRASRCLDRIQAVRMLAKEVGQTHSVLGWVEGPMAELVDLRGMESAMVDLYEDPDAVHAAMEVLVDKAVDFAECQIEEGADTIGVGDAAASVISPEMYREFVLPHEQDLISGIQNAGGKVKLHICGDTRKLVPLMAQTGADVIDLDYPVHLAEARRQVGPRQVLAGNFNPVSELKDASPDQVQAAAECCIREGGPKAFILQPGCEVPPGTPVENLRAFCPNA